ncbi:TOBE domain-containing protein [Tunturibacter empetritectus]|uniref:Molybdopterin-binding protein n=1 Tax=Tunturiibacter lichenicola TaxID=2051959 RepID=A0A7W8JAQ1_9BACT|nr:TOBE domain-containing protein [Edaphobacter lichenicola]MBB5345803.1 molybdopterin-binding protein [Edaphobacter lichenicola]
MKTSARNMLAGTISKITKGAVNSEVLLRTGGGDEVAAIITNGSVDAMGLKDGMKAYALVKASWIIIGKELDKSRISTRNILCGVVESIHEGSVNDEVSIKLPGGELLTGVITDGSLHRLELHIGETVCAAFKASSVIVAVD